MAKIITEKRAIEYAKDFKVKVVEFSEDLDVKTIDIADILNLHPTMLYRWRQEFREGKLSYGPSQRINMLAPINNPTITDQQLLEFKELKLLRKKNAMMEKKIGVLKSGRGI